MGRKIVHDDNIAGPQQRHQMLLDPGTEYLAVHWTIHHQRRDDGIAAQASDEGGRLPMTVRYMGDRRSPLWQRPRSLVMAVLVPVSSMNTSRAELSRA